MKYLITLITLFCLCACDEVQTADKTLGRQQEQIMQEAARQVGMPAIVNFQERKLLKQIIELRDQEHLICYAYLIAEMTGKLTFFGKCLGYGIPYATEYTNPMKPGYLGMKEGVYTVPQADPNGLYMPASADATWLMMLDAKGEPHPVYVEPKVIVSPFPLESK